MAEPFLSEIRLMSFGYAPQGWATCDGQVLPINQNQALFSLLGTTFGGNGQTTFALPDLRGRVSMHLGEGHALGERGGETAHTLTQGEMATHPHWVTASSANATASAPGGNVLASSANLYAPSSGLGPLITSTVANTGGGQPHENMQPYLAINFCIALQGIYPSQN